MERLRTSLCVAWVCLLHIYDNLKTELSEIWHNLIYGERDHESREKGGERGIFSYIKGNKENIKVQYSAHTSESAGRLLTARNYIKKNVGNEKKETRKAGDPNEWEKRTKKICLKKENIPDGETIPVGKRDE